MEALLKASEASGLMGVSMRHVRRMAQSGALSYQIHMNAQNRPEYLFPLSSLPDAAQQKYFAEHAPAALPAAAPAKAKKADKPAACKPLEAYTAEERGEIGYWITTVDRWQTYRNKAGTKKAECDEKFVLLCRMEEPDRQISVETLYRKWAAIREGDYGALVDMRGKARKGMSKMPEAIERVFLSLFLDESQLPVPRCIALTEEWAQQNMPEAMPLPGYHTFYRKAKAVPYPVMVLCRMGEKKYYDLCSPYIRREYESINANDFWVGDTHTLDVESMGPDGTLHRLYLSAWLDARSGIFTGWYVTDSPGSQATLNALRKGILKFGIPSRAYVDNGREFLTYDIGGRGHRAKKRLADGSEPFAPPGVFERLGIEMTNAIVRNARAKLVERRFEDVKNYISRLFPTYTGGNVVEKPNRLKAVLKRGEHIPTDAEVIAAVDTLIEGYMNCDDYGGSVAEDKGKSRIQVWHESLRNGVARRPASDNDLQLMLLRTSKPVRIGRRGVTLKLHGLELDFYTPELVNMRMKEKVYVRYDTEDLSSVRVYDMPADIGRYIEVFGGAGWVLFGREPSSKVMEVFNDYDAELVNIYRCIKYHPDALQHELDMLPDAREVFFDCLAQEQVRGLTDIQRAARSLYLIKASFGTDRRTFATAPKGVCNISASFPAVQERLRRVIIENLDFEHLIKTYDRENALFYCDPPYVETEKYYRARFQESDHKRLADALHNIKGRFLLSYNDCPQVRELYADCIIEPVSRRNTLSAQSVDGYKEVLVRNYEL